MIFYGKAYSMCKYIYICSILLLYTSIASAKILYVSVRNGEVGIYVMDDDGNNRMLLTDTNSPTYPRWSPDGKKIVFVRRALPENAQSSYLFLMNPDGKDISQLTGQHNGFDDYPTFSPDGRSILFLRYERLGNGNNKFSIKILNLVNREIHEISKHPANYLDWSPDGRKIIFSESPMEEGHRRNVYIMDADGDNRNELLPLPPVDDFLIFRTYQRWSQDGQQILYVQREIGWLDNQRRIIELWKAHRFMISDSNGNFIQQLDIPINRFCVSVDWMDNDQSIIFSGCEVELNKPILPNTVIPPYNIYKFHIDSGKIIRLTERNGDDHSVDWISDDVYLVSPNGKQTVRWGALKTLSPVNRPKN